MNCWELSLSSQWANTGPQQVVLGSGNVPVDQRSRHQKACLIYFECCLPCARQLEYLLEVRSATCSATQITNGWSAFAHQKELIQIPHAAGRALRALISHPSSKKQTPKCNTQSTWNHASLAFSSESIYPDFQTRHTRYSALYLPCVCQFIRQ